MSHVPSWSRRWCDARGQASVEVVGSAGFLLLAGLIGFQLLGFGYAAVMADNAAEAAALAIVNGRDPGAAAREALPAWPAGAVRVRAERGRVTVTLLPPSPLRLLRERLATTAEAVVREPPRGSRGRTGEASAGGAEPAV
jgi:hypothetical protein